MNDQTIAQKYFDIDSTYRNRKNYINPYDFVVPYSFPNKGSTTLSFFDPILDSSPFTGSSLQPGQLYTQSSTDTTHITLDANDSSINNFYINITLQLGSEFRTITDYNGATRVATVDLPFSALPAPGTQYFTRRIASYFNSNVAIVGYNPATNTVDRLNLLTATPSPTKDFYAGSYVRFTNGPHASQTALITKYEPNNSILAWSQPSSVGVNAFLSTTTEQGFVFSPNVAGVINTITLNLSSFENTSPRRSFLLRIRSGAGLNGAILYSNTFTISNNLTPTDTTFAISSLSVGPTQYFTITLIDTTVNGLTTGYINLFGITPTTTLTTYGELLVYPKTSITVFPTGTVISSQPNTNVYTLDNVTSIVSAAFSLRRLRSSYSGNAIRVRRSSDNAEQDIGFVSDQLDITSLKTFVGTSNGYIKTWYDQSTNSYNFVQNTNSLQPRIMNLGVLDNMGGYPVLVFDGVDDYMSFGYPFATSSSCSINLVCKLNASAAWARFFDLVTAAPTIYFIGVPYNGTTGRFQINNGTGDRFVNFTATTDTNNHVFTFNLTGTNMNVTRDRTSLVSTAVTSILPSSLSGTGYICKSQSGDPYLSANYQEIIFFGSVLSSGDQVSVENDQKTYFQNLVLLKQKLNFAILLFFETQMLHNFYF